ncbi:basic amino acid/polyamine antiporter [Bordetella avium]|uniref:Arginine/ornithine antiporter n=1 Tax=Bordetella avium (strain 197N) TaxID=360910 RepID=Q2KWF3_BORA1|nr:basic amino acid/polyamine antiporter [Bordetella avium]AZY50021.1 amino acid permease [Bordetella avium]AZY53386.1 amino acid permease [Bordetella avium]RIQ13020.1 amino acid permease [Bordetella avium]RIQ37582.1 amino acid permease [Bordetella avium]RIQ42289.1 amino acid permease [Bordetella avium]
MDKESKPSAASQKFGLIALIAIVVSSMIGSGVDSLPQNMAEQSAVGPVTIAWLICGFGMYFIAKVFIVLSDLRPDLQTGIYMYAREGFGPFAAFLVAWGYWLMNIFSNVAFAVMVMDTLDYFMPGTFKGGNNLNSLIGASILIWGFHVLVLSGSKLAGTVNVVGTVAKLIPLVIFVGTVVYFLDGSELTQNVWGHANSPSIKPLGSVISQILSPLFVALWCFIGIEGAVALSGRARNTQDVGRATLIGFIISLAICLIVSVIPFGVMNQHALSSLPNPSTAGVMKALTGDWGEWFINVGVLISILTSWLAWTMICAEIPMAAAANGTFPAWFARKNKHGAAASSLWASSWLMQAVMLLVYFANNAWLALLAISSITVLPAYLAASAYLTKLCLNGEYSQRQAKGKRFALISSLIGAAFCLFMLYASAIEYVAMTPLIITLGVPVFIWARKRDQRAQPLFSKREAAALIALLLLDALIAYLYFTGVIRL